MTVHRQQLGKLGEDLALAELQTRGYALLTRNYRTGFGEVDIIAQDKNTLCFVEVRTRMSEDQGHPLESITPEKKRKLIRCAMCYLEESGKWESETRFDVVAIIPQEEGQFGIEIVRDAFSMDPEENL